MRQLTRPGRFSPVSAAARERTLMRRTRATQATTPPEIHKPDEQWRQELTRQQYDVLRRAHTEPAFTGKYVHAKDNGSYCCAGAGMSCSARTPSSNPARAGRASPSQPSQQRSNCGRTRAGSCAAPRWSAAAAAVIWAMSSATGPLPPASAIASTPVPWPSSHCRLAAIGATASQAANACGAGLRRAECHVLRGPRSGPAADPAPCLTSATCAVSGSPRIRSSRFRHSPRTDEPA